ncbi:MAG: hypothetical protein DMG54_03705 [Acidobacteria bacterium]|nr:MAG: hypothetical protein DMG54_03705 [Acidobacteriota bacterium]
MSGRKEEPYRRRRQRVIRRFARARRVVKDGGGDRTGFAGKTGKVALVTIEDFGYAGERGAEVPFTGMKPVADGRK